MRPKSGAADHGFTMLIDATLKYPMPPLALPKRERGTGARNLEATGLARAARAATLARLFVRRLERGLGPLCAECRRRRMGGKRAGHVPAASRRAHSRNSSPVQGGRAAQIPTQRSPLSRRNSGPDSSTSRPKTRRFPGDTQWAWYGVRQGSPPASNLRCHAAVDICHRRGVIFAHDHRHGHAKSAHRIRRSVFPEHPSQAAR